MTSVTCSQCGRDTKPRKLTGLDNPLKRALKDPAYHVCHRCLNNGHGLPGERWGRSELDGYVPDEDQLALEEV